MINETQLATKFTIIRHILFVLSILFIIIAGYTGHWCFDHHTSKAIWAMQSQLSQQEIEHIVITANNLKFPAFLFGAVGALGFVLFLPRKLSSRSLPILGVELPKSIELPIRIIASIEIIILLALISFCIVMYFINCR